MAVRVRDLSFPIFWNFNHLKEEVLVFLDAHCEAGYNWLPPLLAPIARNDRISTVPLIDVINGQTYDFTGQAGGDIYGRAQVSFIYIKSPIKEKYECLWTISYGTTLVGLFFFTSGVIFWGSKFFEG